MKVSYLFFLLFICYSVVIQSASLYIDQSSLPKKIETFLDQHFYKYDIKELKYDSKDGKCKVKYTNGIKIEFDNNAEWKEIESDYVPLPKSIIDILPRTTIDFIAKKYPRRAVVKMKRKSGEYKIKLEGSLELVFDSKGRLVEVDD